MTDDGAHSLPSPNTSPSLTDKDLDLNSKSRKRQRSPSMETESDPGPSSSSLKRSEADHASNTPPNPLRSPQSNTLSTLSISDSDNEIDSYMATQGDGDPSDSVAPLAQNDGVSTPPPQEKLRAIESLNKTPLQVGQTWYIISRLWYKRWSLACSGHIDKEGTDESNLGPVDNSSIIDRHGNLRPFLSEGIDVEYVPADAWKLFAEWYGQPLHPLPRKVITRGINQEKTLEIYPPRLKALVIVADSAVTDTTDLPSSSVSLSVNDTVNTMRRELADAVRPAGVSPETPFRVWKLPDSDDGIVGTQFPASKMIGAASIVRESSKTLSEAYVETGEAFGVEFCDSDSWLLDDPESQSSTPPPIFGDNTGFFSKFLPQPTAERVKTVINGFGSSFAGPSTSFRSSNPLAFGPVAKRPTYSIEPGTIGLGNLGNTCFMNSALQCLAHTKELTDFFLLGVYKEDLNPDNPLGMHGAIAESFGALLKQMWAPSSTTSSYYPREFKQQLQRFAPQFSGYQQHDSQELVAFLLDGLHEDLNRVLKKPYVAKPEWEGGGERELVELATKSWEGYMQRNDSVIVDLFQGQYQSTLVCPECEKVSITFDPFMYLTLPLPVQKKWRHAVHYVPWDPSLPHLKVLVELPRDSSFKDLRNLVGRWMNAEPQNLLTMEIFNHRFYKNLDDSVMCGDMADHDLIVCFELPCNSRQSRGCKMQPDDPFILPLHLAGSLRTTYSRGLNLFGYPCVVVIGKEQATDRDAIYTLVVERLQRWTSHAKDLYDWETSSRSTSESMDEVPIHYVSLPPVESTVTTEIKENGDVVTVEEALLEEEGDITNEKGTLYQEEGEPASTEGQTDDDGEPQCIRPKQGIFNLRLQANHKDYGTGISQFDPSPRYERWPDRIHAAETEPALLREHDALVCEFLDDAKVYYFGDERTRWDRARWDTWEEYTHPEYVEARRASTAIKSKGISLQDCLDEFTREERLGEDDLWYCPRCKKHQQATKKFDLWKAPDVLVVHLKRFSNSRMLRDKIDTFVDFPLQDLDLTEMVGERRVATKLAAQGEDIEALGLSNLEEPLIYDLFGVDEHMGGLGGGHYRAYALNHVTQKWYHFDDSFVTDARPTDAVNANAYLLFFRRRTDRPLGGKTHAKLESARLHPKSPTPEPIIIEAQLPTPPNESAATTSNLLSPGMSRLSAAFNVTYYQSPQASGSDNGWPLASTSLVSASPPPPLDEAYDLYTDPLLLASEQFDFPDPAGKASPSSSNEAQDDFQDGAWRTSVAFDSPDSDWQVSHADSPVSSVSDTLNPFGDANAQKDVHEDGQEHTYVEESIVE